MHHMITFMSLMSAELYFCCCSCYRWIKMNKRTNERKKYSIIYKLVFPVCLFMKNESLCIEIRRGFSSSFTSKCDMFERDITRLQKKKKLTNLLARSYLHCSICLFHHAVSFWPVDHEEFRESGMF